MAILKIASFLVCALAAFTAADLHGQGFLAQSPKVHANTICDELTGVLGEVLGDGHGVTEERLKTINATLLPIFRSLPKNARGHVSEPIMKYVMRRYFSATHAWILKGFEANAEYAISASNSDVDILQSKVPGFVRSALEHKFAHQGFSLPDLVSMVAVLETLAFNEAVRGVEASFNLNSFAQGTRLSQAQMQDVLESYVIIEMLEGASTDSKEHLFEKKNVHSRYSNWDQTKSFLSDVSGSDVFGRHSSSNPFTARTFAFEDVMRMAVRVSEEFGAWSSYECHDMKDVLARRDVHGTGRLKLLDFYKASAEGKWQFLEASAYLRQLGALDESSEYLGPQVIIPNYITGLSNCLTSGGYFSVCCLNECDSIYQHIEDKLENPTGTVSELLEAVQSLPSFPEITTQLIAKLEDIALIDGGSIPIHGRLFAQWLHFAFPRDCPYPHATGAVSPMSPPGWRDEVGEDFESVSADEIKQLVKDPSYSRDPSPDAGTGMWDFQEAVMDFSTPSDTEDANLAWALRIGSQCMIIGAFAVLLVREGVKSFGASKSALDLALSSKKAQYSI